MFRFIHDMFLHSILNYLTEFSLQQQKKHDGVDPQVSVEKDDGDKGGNMEFQECNAMMSYTQLLTAPLGGVYDENMF